MRAGAYALTLLSVPLNVDVLTALDGGPMALVDLRRAAGSPPQTTTRKQLKLLTDIGVLERQQQAEFPGSVRYELGRAGRELLGVASAAASWLSAAPDLTLELGTPAAKYSIKALVDGWSSTLVRALAGGPLSLTQLSRLISTINYPSLERRLAAMRLTGQVETSEKAHGRSHPYAVTPWLRRAIAPLAAAAAWERQFVAGEAAALSRIDIESSFLLALPLVRMPSELTGTARMVVDLRSADDQLVHAGATVRIVDGTVVSCVSRLEGPADAWNSGSVGAWLKASVGGDADGLETGGDCELARALVEGFHGALFGAAAQPA